MRGVNLSLFDFDYDLTWMAFFLSHDEKVYGRYGGRDAESPDSRQSLAGLRFAMAQALEAHRRHAGRADRAKPRTVDDYAAAARWRSNRCTHCHQVYEIRRESLRAEGKWQRDDVWVYPLPENVGLTLSVDDGNLVRAVADRSPAARTRLAVGDRLKRVDGLPVASFADVQYALHRAPPRGEVAVRWERAGRPMSGRLRLAAGWRVTDVSWRKSLRSLEPLPWVDGDDLTADEKKQLGLSAKRLAFHQLAYLSTPARQAGLKPRDVIIGIDDKVLEMTARQFLAYVRLNYRVGDRVTYNVLRHGQRVDVPLTLSARPPF
jgi:predicted metalloprotease with PDZ domain